MSIAQSYSSVSRFFHWLIAGLIITQFILAELAEWADDNNQAVQQLALLANHKSIGMTIVILAVLRLVWRMFNTPPPLPNSMALWQQRASAVAHWLMYGLIFAIPISGWLMSSASAYSVSWFNLFVFPDLVAPSEGLADLLHETHEVLAKLLLVVVLVHIAAALKHHFVDKDGVLRRMASASGWLLLLASIVIGVGVFGRVSSDSKEEKSQVTDLGDAAPGKISTLPVWNIDYQNSVIRFSGDQAGAPFTGVWQQWEATIQFDADHLDMSRFDVIIEAASVFSNDDERDQTIVDPDFFDVERHPKARFVAAQFTARQDGSFDTNGRLTMKGVTNLATLNFRVTNNDDDTITLTGLSTLDRFAWNIGMGDWTDTTWVGQDVKVEVRVVAKAGVYSPK